jgi:hypothetical protein
MNFMLEVLNDRNRHDNLELGADSKHLLYYHLVLKRRKKILDDWIFVPHFTIFIF